MVKEKTCFVIMPIGQEGSEQHAHFKSLYEEILRPAIAAKGYDVLRADEVQKSGAITKDIILRLAEADLVVADLTDMNPNVFYELGTRHSLRGQGTIMMLDEARTERIPFDLGAYRVLKFVGKLTGFAKLRRELEAFIDAQSSGSADRRDNPVHDWLPLLPANAIETSRGSVEGELREKLARVEQRVREYEEKYGIAESIANGAASSPLNTVMDALEQARNRSLPDDLLRSAESAASKHDAKEFLSVLRKILEREKLRVAPMEFLRLAAQAMSLGLGDVVGAVFDHARQLHPHSDELRNAQLAHFAHSANPTDRERARKELRDYIGIVAEDDNLRIPGSIDDEHAALFGIMLDAYHADSLHEQGLRITEVAVQQFPNRSTIVRNHARALENTKRPDEALEWYKRALQCPDANETTAIWLGNELHNRRRHVDGVEAYLRACLFDPDDADGFAHVADELVLATRSAVTGLSEGTTRNLPDTVSTSTITEAIVAALSCTMADLEDLNRCQAAAKKADVDFEAITCALGAPGAGGPEDGISIRRMGLRERVDFALGLYELFRSELTAPSKAGSER